jgi:hypothetical protein
MLDSDREHLKLRKRQVSWERAEKARLALTPYLQEIHENDLRFALTDLLVDVFHLAARTGYDLDSETIADILRRSKAFFAAEEAEQYLPAFGKVGPKE